MKKPVLETLFNQVAGLKTCNFFKKRLQYRCFPVKFAKFLRTPFSTEHLQWLLLKLNMFMILLQMPFYYILE